MDADMKATRISIGIHALAAIAMGWLSIQLASTLHAVAVAIVLLILIGFGVERLVKKKGLSWWAGNGLIIYLLIWIVSWTYFFNLALV